MTTLIIVLVIAVAVAAVALYALRQKNREAAVARADELRAHAATQAQSTLPPAQDRAAEAEARAEEARAAAERAEAEAEEARIAAQHTEAEHEAQVRAADRLDPRVDHRADDYAPRVGGTVDQQPTPPSEVNRATGTGATTTEPQAAPAEPEAAPEPQAAPVAEAAAESRAEHSDGTTTEGPTAAGTPRLPRRTPGANEMPGKPMEGDGTSGGWFTRKDEGSSGKA